MNKNHSIVSKIARLIILATVLTLASGAGPVSAHNTPPQDTCGDLPECGYILMHMRQVPNFVPECSQIAECGYIQMHIQASQFQTAVTVIPFGRPGIPVTGCSGSLYIGQGYRLMCGAYLTYGQ
jgi:hypothetical protein